MDNVDAKFYEQFEKINHQYDEFLGMLESVEVMSDNKLFAHYLKQKKQIEQVALAFKKYKAIENEIALNNEIYEIENDEEVRANIKKENVTLSNEMQKVFDNIKVEFLKQEQEIQTAKIEITPRNANDEGSMELVSMIKNIFENEDAEILINEAKTIAISIKAKNAFNRLSFLSGLVKQTRLGKDGLFQVVVLNDESREVVIDEKDIVVEISKSSGAGGQHINKTESAVKLTHIPTGITAECQDERSQIKNKIRAMEHLKQKILQNNQEITQKNIKSQRRMQKNAIFSNTPVLIFDYDKNIVSDCRTKKNYPLKEILSGNTKLIESDLRI